MTITSQKLSIVVDFPWSSEAHMGTGVYSETMVRALASAGKENIQITLIASPDAPKTINMENVHYHSLKNVDIREGFRQIALPMYLEKVKADCLFAPATLLPMVKVCPMVTTVHDLTFIKHPEFYDKHLIQYLNEYFEPSIRSADRIIAISQDTKSDLQKYLDIEEEKIVVIEQPVRETFHQRLPESEANALTKEMKIDQPFFFHVSNLAPHKNTEFCIKVFAHFLESRVQKDHLLIFAGGGSAPNKQPDVIRIAESYGVGKFVKYLGRVSDDQLKVLYQNCQAFLFPSLAEGWGLPVAEANSLQAKIIASPHVPAAAKEQQFPLEVELWTKAIINTNISQKQTNCPLEAGQNLYKILSNVNSSMQFSQKSITHNEPISPVESLSTKKFADISYHFKNEVLHNVNGVSNETLATPHNTTIVVFSENIQSLKNLLSSLNDISEDISQVAILGNTYESIHTLKNVFPQWKISQIQKEDFSTKGLRWFDNNRPEISNQLKINKAHDDFPAWVKNKMLLACKTRFLIALHDDIVVKAGWLDYLLTMQNRLYAYAIISDLTSTSILLDTKLIEKIGWFDERFSSIDCENDYVIRINEKHLRWLDIQSKDFFQNNKDLISQKNQGQQWFYTKWKRVSHNTGIRDLPPFHEYFLQRMEKTEPNWYPKEQLKPESIALKILPQISILLYNYNTLPFLKLAIKSCREHLARSDHEIIVYDDESTDGSFEWLSNNSEEFNIRILPHKLQNKSIINELVITASHSVILFANVDIFFSKNADLEMWRYFSQSTVVTCTKVSHNRSNSHLNVNFGIDADSFQENAFLQLPSENKTIEKKRCLFAPMMIYKEDFFRLGGYDEIFELHAIGYSDFLNRLLTAGFQHIQSNTSFCYHFCGQEYHDQQWTDSKRNYIRKWGSFCKHEQLEFTFQKQPITLVGLLGSESKNVLPWISHLEPYFDEILLVDDSSDGSADIAREYIEKESQISPLVHSGKLRIIPRSLEGDYGASRNLAHQEASFDWIFHCDLDERWDERSLEQLQEVIAYMGKEQKLVCAFPRINIVDGAVVNDIPRPEWTPERLAKKQERANLQIKNPDLQFRLLQRNIEWINKVHEIPELARNFPRKLPAQVMISDLWILHEKTLLRQAQQDLKYQQLVGEIGPHGLWQPEKILKKLSDKRSE